MLHSRVEKLFLPLATFFLFTPAIIFFLATTGLQLDYSLGARTTLLFAVLIAAFISSAIFSRDTNAKPREILGILIANLLLLAFCVICAGHFIDISYDGQTYQQLGIHLFSSGWNPFYHPPILSESLAQGTRHYANFFNHYPAFAWIVGAVFQQSFGSAEWGKAIHLLLILSAFFVWLDTLAAVSKLERNFPVLVCLALAAALNPVAVTQSQTWYVDGIIASLFSCSLGLWLGLIRAPSKSRAFTLGTTLILLVSTKFTGGVYAAVLLFMYSITLVVIGKRVRSALYVFSFVVSIGIIVFGYHPYLRNTFSKGSPIYPITSYPISGVTPEAELLMHRQLPANLRLENRLTKLFLSTFSVSENVFDPKTANLKWPWQVSANEFRAFVDPDVRVGGFGPLFPFIIVLAGLITVVGAVQEPKCGKLLLMVLGTIISSAMINPEVWWARYAPQLWLIPVVIAGFFLLLTQSFWASITAKVLLLLCVINSLGIFSVYYHAQWNRSASVKAQLAKLSESGLEYSGNFGAFFIVKQRLIDFGIKIGDDTQKPCAQAVAVEYTPIVLCPLTN